MRKAVIINHHGTVEEVSPATFFERVFGHPPLTRQQREDEWRAQIERYADMIEAGGEWGVPPPCLADARALVAERENFGLPNYMARKMIAADPECVGLAEKCAASGMRPRENAKRSRAKPRSPAAKPRRPKGDAQSIPNE